MSTALTAATRDAERCMYRFVRGAALKSGLVDATWRAATVLQEREMRYESAVEVEGEDALEKLSPATEVSADAGVGRKVKLTSTKDQMAHCSSREYRA